MVKIRHYAQVDRVQAAVYRYQADGVLVRKVVGGGIRSGTTH